MQQQLMEQAQQQAVDAGYVDDSPSLQQQQFQSPVPHRQQHDWVPLDDEYNMVDEMSVPRDYYVDKPVSTPSFISDSDYSQPPNTSPMRKGTTRPFS